VFPGSPRLGLAHRAVAHEEAQPAGAAAALAAAERARIAAQRAAVPLEATEKHHGHAVHSGSTPRSQRPQKSGAVVMSLNEFSALPHHGQTLIASAIGPLQR